MATERAVSAAAVAPGPEGEGAPRSRLVHGGLHSQELGKRVVDKLNAREACQSAGEGGDGAYWSLTAGSTRGISSLLGQRRGRAVSECFAAGAGTAQEHRSFNGTESHSRGDLIMQVGFGVDWRAPVREGPSGEDDGRVPFGRVPLCHGRVSFGRVPLCAKQETKFHYCLSPATCLTII